MTNALTIISSLAPLLLLIYLTWKEYKSGTSGLADKIREDYKERNGQLEKDLELMKTKFQQHEVEIGKLQVINQEKDRQIAEYKEIFANRNPDLTEVLASIKTFMENIYNQNKYQTGILEKRQVRDQKIDEASAKHKGSPMMAPVRSAT